MSRKLRQFLSKRKRSYTVPLVKSVNCPDCGDTIIHDNKFSACLCLGFTKAGISIAKSENGYQITFDKNWSQDNLELLLQILINKNNKGE